MKHLADNTSRNLIVAVECAQYFIDGDAEGWAIYRSRDALQAIFSAALSSRDPSVHLLARKAINGLGERGFYEFGDLLQRR